MGCCASSRKDHSDSEEQQQEKNKNFDIKYEEETLSNENQSETKIEQGEQKNMQKNNDGMENIQQINSQNNVGSEMVPLLQESQSVLSQSNLPYEVEQENFQPQDSDAKEIQPMMKMILTKSTIIQIQDTFKTIDKDNSGYIDKQEAIYIWKQHLTRVNIDTLFNAMDEDQNGKISMEEWMNFWILASNCGYDEYDIQDKLDDFLKERTKLRVLKVGVNAYY